MPSLLLTQTKNVKVPKNSMGSHVPTFGHDIVVVASGARAHERCMLSRDIATGASKLVAALLVARFADGRTATLTYSQSAALLTIEELSAGVYIHFDAIALMSAENDDANRQYRLCGWRRCRRYRRPKLRSGRRDCSAQQACSVCGQKQRTSASAWARRRASIAFFAISVERN
jgi:hypothetical protein